MNKQIKGILYVALILVATLSVAMPYIGISTVNAALQGYFVVRPIIYDNVLNTYNVSWSPIWKTETVPVNLSDTSGNGSEIALDLTNLNTTTASYLWIWISTEEYPSAAIVKSKDAVLIGPIPATLVSNKYYTPLNNTNIYKPFNGNMVNDLAIFTNWTYTTNGLTVGTPPLLIGKVIVGNNTIIIRLPKILVQGVKYYIKITDISPDIFTTNPSALVPAIPSSNPFTVVQGIWEITPVQTTLQEPYVIPNETIRITGIGISQLPFNITINGNVLEDKINQTASIVNYTTYLGTEWNATQYTTYIKVPDLELIDGTTASVTVSVVTGNNVNATKTFTELYRYIMLNATNVFDLSASIPYSPSNIENITNILVPHYNYNVSKYNNIAFRAPGTTLNMTLYNFPYEGSATVSIVGLNNISYSKKVAVVNFNDNGTASIFNLAIPIDINESGNYSIVIKDNDGVIFNFTVLIHIVPYITVSPEEGYVGEQVNVTLHRFDDYVGDIVTLWFKVNDNYVVELANTTINHAETTITVTIPAATGGNHTIYAADKLGNWATYGAWNTTFTVLPKVWVEPSVVTPGTKFITIYATGLVNEYYDILVDQGTILWGFQPTADGNLTVTIPATGLKPGLHVVALYQNYWAQAANVTEPQLYATFTVAGPTLEDVLNAVNGLSTQLNDVVVGINDLKALITSLGDDITLKLQSINNTLATLIVEKNNEVIAKLCTKLNELNATIVSIKGDVVELKTAVGDIQTTLQALKSSNAELKDLIVTKSGEIKGVIETTAGNITANLNALEQLIKSGLKVDTQTLLSKIDEIKSQLSSISGSVSTVSSKLDQLASTLDDLKSMLSNVQSTVSNVQSTVTDIKSSLQDIKNTANSLASKIESTASDLKSYISSQNSDLKKAVEGISGTVSTYGIISIILIIIAIAVSGYGVYKKKE
ncbi:MAG: hypothetical protein GXO43_06680 [Crenarchaeota archaeon]|nr:hypothetical protein [Thermoproteota archaeon]